MCSCTWVGIGWAEGLGTDIFLFLFTPRFFCIIIVFNFSWDLQFIIPREIEKNAYAKILRVNKASI